MSYPLPLIVRALRDDSSGEGRYVEDELMTYFDETKDGAEIYVVHASQLDGAEDGKPYWADMADFRVEGQPLTFVTEF